MSLPKPYFENDRAIIYCGDCLPIIPHLSGIDCVVTDPPNGMNATTANMNRGNANCRWALPTAKSAWPTSGNDWDNEAPKVVEQLPEIFAGDIIVWGGQFFRLPLNRCWLVWNKIIRNFQSSVCELAWTNLNSPVDAFDYSHGQLAHEGKQHPTQKPEPLMKWCVAKVSGSTILDPFMGSGTTGVACMKLGRKFIGIEISEAYCKIAAKRIAEASEWDALLTSAERKETNAQTSLHPDE